MSQAAYGCQAGPNQVAHRFVSTVRDPNGREFTCAMQSGQLHRISAICLDPVSRATGDQRWRDDAIMASSRDLTLNTVPARPSFVANVELDPRATNLAQQLRQRRRRVGDLAMLADFSALFALRYRNRYRVLVDVQSDILHRLAHRAPPCTRSPQTSPVRSRSCILQGRWRQP